MNILYLPTVKRFAWELFLCLFLCLFSFFILPNIHTVLAARYWVGASDGANISDTANWATTQSACSTNGGASVPTTTDLVYFTSSCTNGATINQAFSVLGINIGVGYSATVTQSPSSKITIGTSGYAQAAGIFSGSAGTTINDAIDINGSSFSVTGGDFTSTAGILSIEGSFTVTDPGTFTHHSGTVTFDGGLTANATIDASGVVFNTPVTINRSYSSDFNLTTLTINSGTTIPLGNSATVTLKNNSGRSDKPYNLINNGAITAGTGVLTINLNPASTGTFTNNGTFDISSLTTLTINGHFTNSSGKTITSTTLASLSTFDFTNNGTITTINANTFTINGTFTNSAGAIFTPAAGSTFNVAGGFIINSGSTFPASNINLNLNGALTANATIDASGVVFNTPVTINRSYSSDFNLTTLTINSGTTIPLGNSATVTLKNNSGRSDKPYNLINNGAITAGTGVLTIDLNPASTGTFTNNGTFDISSLTTLTINGHFTNSSGATVTYGAGLNYSVFGNTSINAESTFPATLGILTITGTSGTQTYDNPKTTTYSAFVKNAASTLTLSQGFSTGDFTISSGTISNPGSSMFINVSGNFSQTGGTLGGANLPIVFNGAVDKTITQSSGTFSSPFTISKTSSVVSLATNLTTSGQTCTVSSGTFFLNGKTITCGSTFTVQNGATLRLVGSEMPTTPTLDAGSTVEYKGDGDGFADSYQIKNWNYQNLTIDMIDSTDTIRPTNPIPTDTYRYWKFDDGTGITAVDSSGNGKSGTLQNMEEGDWDSSIKASTIFTNNYSLNFGGTNEQVIASDTTDPSIYTLCAWVRPNDVTSTSIIMRSNGMPTAMYQDQLRITSGSNFEYRSWDGSRISVISTTTVQADNWYHICATAQNGGQAKLYINGIEEGTPDSVGTMDTGPDRWHIGSNGGDSMGFYVGYIDDIRIYNRILTTNEIAALANATTTVPLISVVGNYSVSSGTFTAPATLNVAGNFINIGGTFDANGGEVVLNGTNQEIQGSTIFNNLTKTVTSPATLTFPGDVSKLQTITGAMTLKGTAGNLLTLQSSLHTTQFRIDPQSTRDVEYLAVHDSNNINATNILTVGKNLTSLGNNTGWNFNQTPNNPSSLVMVGTVDGGYTTNNQPQMVFSLTDPDAADTIKYQIQIDDNSDFSSPVIDYTSGLLTQGLITYSVGQILTDGSYYWRVMAIDNSDATSAFALAHSGAVAFIVDVTAPSTPGAPSTTTPTNSTSQTWSWTTATDAVSGVASYIWRTTGTAIVTGTSAINSAVTSVAEGIYNFFVKAVDTAGNQGVESLAGTVTVDTTAPITTDSGIDTSWYNAPVTVTLACGDVGGTGCADTYYTTDGNDPTNSSPQGNSFLISSEGTHIVKYFSIDAVGNSEPIKTAMNTVKIDKTKPIVSVLHSAPNSTSSIITWKTDENCSSKVDYGLTSNYGSTTLETNTFTRVTDHSVELPSLSSCTTYHYAVRSKDVATNENIDTDAIFTTTGCVGLVEAIATASAQINKDIGGTLILQDNSSNGLTLTIPSDSFVNQDINFQAHQLDTESILAVTSIPVGYSTAGNYIYELKALTDNVTTVSTFRNALTVRITYDEDDIFGLDESTFKIYRWDGNSWSQLSDCIVDISTKTVTCTTTTFSVFGLFGQTSSFSSSNSSSSNSSSSSFCTTSPPGAKAPWLFGAISQDSGSIMLYFTPADSPVSTYVLEYGTKSGEYSYGILDMNVNSPEQMTFLVKSLSPNTTYFFKIRAGNGCATGTWSNEISAKTKGLISFNQLIIPKSKLKVTSLKELEKTEPPKNEQKETQESRLMPPSQNTGYDVNVVVVDINNIPVEGAKVTIHSKVQEAITDKNGIAKFQNVETGDHKVLIVYKNFEGEQSVNLAGNVKRFDLNVTVSPKTVLLSSLSYVIIGVLILVIITLTGLLLRKKPFSSNINL